MADEVTYDDVLEAVKRMSGKIHRTPVMTSSTLDKLVGRKVYMKCENFQKTGSFKARGALNTLLKMKSSGHTPPGVVTHSSGNHAQGLAWAATNAGIPCKVVVPNNTPKVKIEAISGYGADVVLCQPTLVSRIETCKSIQDELNYVYISSHDHYDIMAGDGTIAVEFLEEVPHLDVILACVSGGGLAAGTALTAKAINPDIKVFAVEPYGKELEASLRAGEALWTGPPTFVDTIAEGIRVKPIGKKVFPVMLKYVEKEVFSITNEEIIEAMKFTWQRTKLVIENSSAAAVAAVMSDKMKQMDPSLKHIGVVVCGGNVDLNDLPWVTYQQKTT